MSQLLNFRRLAAGILTVAVVCSQGCGGGGTQGEKPTVDRDATLGTWVEVAPGDGAVSSNPRFVAPPPRTKNLRQVTINDDGTYVLELVTRKGKTAGDGKIEGSWSISGGYVNFETGANGLPENLKTMAPTRSKGRDVHYDDNDKPSDILTITDEEGLPVDYFRKP